MYRSKILAWVPIETVTDLAGPCFLGQHASRTLAQAERDEVCCLAFNPTLQRVDVQHVEEAERVSREEALLRDDGELQGAEIVQFDTCGPNDVEPRDVMQVWVATRIPDTPKEAPRYTFRSAEGKYFGAERSGSIHASSEARGPQEEWTLVKDTDDAVFRLRSFHGKFLAFKRMAGGKIAIRADLDPTDGDGQLFESSIFIKVQWKFRNEARKRESGR